MDDDTTRVTADSSQIIAADTRIGQDTIEKSLGDDLNWRSALLRWLDDHGFRDQFSVEYLLIEEADCRAREEWLKEVESGGNFQQCCETFFLRRLDNCATVFLTLVSTLEDKFWYSDTLKRWCDEVLPTLEFDFRAHYGWNIVKELEERLGPFEGKIPEP